MLGLFVGWAVSLSKERLCLGLAVPAADIGAVPIKHATCAFNGDSSFWSEYTLPGLAAFLVYETRVLKFPLEGGIEN